MTMTAFRTAQPLAWTFHRGTVRRRSDNPQVLQPRPEPGREDPSAPWIKLPPSLRVAAPLADLVRGRVSCRVFRDEPIGFAELATLLRAGYGVTDDSAMLDRAVPSGGGLYPLEVSLLVRSVDGLPAGIYHYVPLADGLERVRGKAVPEPLIRNLFLGQPWAAEAAVVLVFSAVCARSLGKYGDRGYRYLLLEAGHAAQNVVLTATGLGLGSVNLGGFFDDELSGLLRLDVESEIVLYGTAIGHPTPGNRIARRGLDRLTDG
ncbi:SagB/ThcOx family dehydrogenase [Kribbella pittospori]|uniref:SagB/ThcOx family dehydrogenase n=1 Tax=Kribbella pittospori TaxID=722689 RepID=A0A4V2MB79_9ACTN|nr:SagB/ThcOx family dehydrogenase [Kribbella pittospori]TCC62122.1 SagB/ThcOx family dehydrogenase [Kribbella pittospori]